MKIKSFLSILFLIALATFSSCDLLDNADDVAFDATLPMDFIVNETADSPTGIAYSDSRLLDATSNADVAKYANKIKEIKVNKITYTVSGANPNTVSFTDGVLKISSTGKNIATESSVDLASTAENELTLDTAGLNELSTKLLDDKKEEILLNGTLSKTPVAFTLKVKFYVTITANAL